MNIRRDWTEYQLIARSVSLSVEGSGIVHETLLTLAVVMDVRSRFITALDLTESCSPQDAATKRLVHPSPPPCMMDSSE
ncbi:hypothetical protein AOLI_G00066170 [Acnodon oligacanthus]